MSKYELSLSKDYVPDWGVVDAVRELFQNALDQETTIEGNQMFFSYNEETQVLSIGNKTSVLNPSTLLLGSSTKRDDDETIGQFGEGYKIATLVLTRLGKPVIFYNYGANEVWLPRFVKSRRYNAEILTFFVNKKFPWKTVPDNDLTITIDNITKEEYESIKLSNLHLTEPVDYITTTNGRILLDEQFAGQVFVNGLYVTEYPAYTYGYDFKPKEIKLDRDRKLVSDFSLQYLSSKMWSYKVDDRMGELAAALVKRDAADTKFVADVWVPSSNITSIADEAHKGFVRDHGINAVPVSSTSEMKGLSPNLTPIIVSEAYNKVIRQSGNYVAPKIEPIISFETKVKNWLDVWGKKMHPEAAKELRDLLEEEKEDGEDERVPF